VIAAALGLQPGRLIPEPAQGTVRCRQGRPRAGAARGGCAPGRASRRPGHHPGGLSAGAGPASARADRGRIPGSRGPGMRQVRQDHHRPAASDRLGPGLRNLRSARQHRNVRPVRPVQADQCPASRGRDLLGLLRQGRAGRDGMQRVRAEAPGSRPDARRHRPLPVLRDPPGPHLLGLRPAAHGCRDHRCRAGLRLVLPGSAAAMRPLRPDPEDRQAGNSNCPGPVLQLLPGRDGGLLGLRGNPALPADLLGQPDLPHLPGPPSPAVFPVPARPAGPGGMARRAGLRRLL